MSEQIDIEIILQELGQVIAGLVNVDDSLEEWGGYHREKKVKGALNYIDIVDWNEEDSKKPFAYSWEGDNYSRGYNPHLIGWSGETGGCVCPLSERKAFEDITIISIILFIIMIYWLTSTFPLYLICRCDSDAIN